MRILITLAFLINITCLLRAQEFVISDTKMYEIEFNQKICRFSVLLEKTSLKLDNSTYYHWYKEGKINQNQGGYAGKLLHGEYTIYSNLGRLLERGVYHKGRKEGEWKKWDVCGKLIEVTHWKQGKLNGIVRQYVEGEKIEKRYKCGVLKKIMSHKSKKKEEHDKA